MAAKKKTTAAEQAEETINVTEDAVREQQTADVGTVEKADNDAAEAVSDSAETEGELASNPAPAVDTEKKKPEKPKTENKRQTVTLTAKMNIRDKPTLDGGILTTKPRGTEIEVISTKGNWLEVDLDGKSAFVLYQKGKYGILS